MNSQTLLVGALVVVGTGCASEGDTLPLRYTGTIHVTERAASGSVFGRITSPEELVPTAATGDCSYFGTRLGAGVTKGDLAITGLVTPVVVEPTSFIDGMLYLGDLEADAVPDGSSITAAVASHRGTDEAPTSVDAVAPTALASVILPDAVSLTNSATITWERGSADEVEVGLTVSGLGTEQALYCRTADIGSFTFPVEALALFEGRESQAGLALTRRNLGHTSNERADLELDLAVESEVFRTVTLIP